MLTNEFRNFADENAEWLNSKWFGRALKRLNLIIDKKRKRSGIEIMLNIPKAKEKIKIFKGDDNIDKEVKNYENTTSNT